MSILPRRPNRCDKKNKKVPSSVSNKEDTHSYGTASSVFGTIQTVALPEESEPTAESEPSSSTSSSSTSFVELSLAGSHERAYADEWKHLTGRTLQGYRTDATNFRRDGALLQAMTTALGGTLGDHQEFDAIENLANKYFMYVLLVDDIGYTLRMHEYSSSNDWYSKHGVILYTASVPIFTVVCAGIFRYDNQNNFIYMDNVSGTFEPEADRLAIARQIVQKALGKRVFTCTEEELKGLIQEIENGSLNGSLKTLVTAHPDYKPPQ